MVKRSSKLSNCILSNEKLKLTSISISNFLEMKKKCKTVQQEKGLRFNRFCQHKNKRFLTVLIRIHK